MTAGTALLVAVACRSPADKAQEGTEALSSWAATIRLAGEQWQRGAVPNAYTRQTLEAAGREIATVRDELRTLPVPPSARERADRLSKLAAALDTAVGRDDHVAARRALAELEADARADSATSPAREGGRS